MDPIRLTSEEDFPAVTPTSPHAPPARHSVIHKAFVQAWIVILGTICIISPATTAQANVSEQKKRLVAAIEAAGCIVHDGNEAAILRAAGLTPAQGSVIVSGMMQSGEAVPSGENLRLNTSVCLSIPSK